MYLKNRNLKIFFYFLFAFHLSLISGSIIRDRSNVNSTNLNNNLTKELSKTSIESVSSNENSSISSNDQLITLSNLFLISNLTNNSIIETKDNAKLNSRNASNESSIKKNRDSNFLEDQKKLIQNLVKEENSIEDKLKNEINLTSFDEKTSTNNIINDEYEKETNFTDNKSKQHISDDSIQSNIDSANKPSIMLKMDEDFFNLRISSSADCIFVRSEEGVYNFYSDRFHTEVCALYLIADSNQLIEFEFEQFNVSCGRWNSSFIKNNQSLISVVDGWELNGQFFPSSQDHFLKKSARYNEICANDTNFILNQKFTVSQNVGLIQFRILSMLEGFRVRVRFIENPKRKFLFIFTIAFYKI